MQLATATRDAFEHAIRALMELEYTVSWDRDEVEPAATPSMAGLL
ncbi:hypothetical protein [Actinomycetospora flava]|uniref:Uncharacterized protein n=1 Tax=Actinomycetospora flava TaxID=3129232 RepID=A0ABU8M9V7_9PSEU